MKLIHYGSSKYNPKLFKPVINSKGWFKPKLGGLWTSPIYSTYSWKDWSDESNYGDTTKSFTLEINDDKILLINSYNDLVNALNITTNKHNLLIKSLYNNATLDYEEISKTYNAIHLTVKGENDTRFSTPFNLYGYDCETVLILNKKCITKVFK